MRVNSDPSLKNYVAQIVGRNMGKAYGCLIEAKDPQAVEQYAKWIKTCETSSFGEPGIYAPLTKMPEATANKIIRSILQDKDSSQNLKSLTQKNGPFAVTNLIRSPLVGFKAFRDIYGKLLDDKQVIGKVFFRKGESGVEVSGLSSNSWSMGPVPIDKADVADAKRANCRACDFYAYAISHNQKAPQFRIYWSVDRKNKAIEELRKFLNEQYKTIIESESRFGRW